jgi:hypothetical protein
MKSPFKAHEIPSQTVETRGDARLLDNRVAELSHLIQAA